MALYILAILLPIFYKAKVDWNEKTINITAFAITFM